MSPAQIMRETDVKKSTFYRLRSGEGRAPSYETIQPIERLFLRRVAVPPVTR